MDTESTFEKRVKLEKRFLAGANGFYWVAGLSLLNSILWLQGSQTTFLIGMGIIQLIDGIATGISEEIGPFIRYVAFVFDILVTLVFVVFGIFTNRKHAWAFIIGMILCGLDGLLFLLVKAWWNIGFHVFILVGITSGFTAYREIKYLGPRPTSPEEI